MEHCAVAIHCLVRAIVVSSRNVTSGDVAGAIKFLDVVLGGKAVSLALLGGAEERLKVESRAIAGEGEQDEHSGNDENARGEIGRAHV